VAEDKAAQPTMHVKIQAAFQLYFDGEAYSISAENGVGPFDILPHHHNFLSILKPCNLYVRTPQGAKQMHISRGLMHVKAEQVVVFVDV
jgi:F0F1-type ATP synthase epsilon subunit